MFPNSKSGSLVSIPASPNKFSRLAAEQAANIPFRLAADKAAKFGQFGVVLLWSRIEETFELRERLK